MRRQLKHKFNCICFYKCYQCVYINMPLEFNLELICMSEFFKKLKCTSCFCERNFNFFCNERHSPSEPICAQVVQGLRVDKKGNVLINGSSPQEHSGDSECYCHEKCQRKNDKGCNKKHEWISLLWDIVYTFCVNMFFLLFRLKPVGATCFYFFNSQSAIKVMIHIVLLNNKNIE